MEVREQQRERLRKTIDWARRLRAELQPIQHAHGDRVHFRPSSTGVAMVGLLPDRPQRGKSGITNLKSITAARRLRSSTGSHAEGRPWLAG